MFPFWPVGFLERLTTAIAFALCGICAARADAPPLNPGRVVESQVIADNPNHVLEPYTVNVHVILQIHETPILARRATEDVGALIVCQERVLSTALFLAEKGVPAVVIEGFYAEGTLTNPSPLKDFEVPRRDSKDAKWTLLGRKELAVYGVAIRYLNDFSSAIANELGKSASVAQDIEKSAGGKPSAAQKMAVENLVQEEIARVNLWRAGILPTTSFLGLQTALAVALARNTRQVQLIIGRDHWPDLIYGINRQKDIRVRLVPYRCS